MENVAESDSVRRADDARALLQGCAEGRQGEVSPMLRAVQDDTSEILKQRKRGNI